MFLSKKNLTRTTLDSSKITAGVSPCKSFNDLTSKELLQNAKHIIVGTLTPKSGRDVGYFYCSDSANQRQFSIIDTWKEDGISLNQKRKDLIKYPNNETIINSINEILFKRRLAFLDVVKDAIAPDNDPSDDSIIEYILDKEMFLNIYQNNPNIVFIANSKNAKVALDFIFGSKKPHIELIPQNPRSIKGGLQEINRLYKYL